MSILKIGTSSFSSKDWSGVFYPSGLKPGDFLKYYSSRFDTVEIDATYYAIPAKQTVEKWNDDTPEGFIFSLKFPRSIVHGGDSSKPNPDKLLNPDLTYPDRDRFLETVSLLGPKLGSLLIQFPYFSKNLFPDKRIFFDRLDTFLNDLPADYRYAVEIRNKYWYNNYFAELCRRHNAALVLVDQAWMPHGDEILGKFDPITTDFSYIRLLGDRKAIEEITKTWNKTVIDYSERLQRWAVLINQLLNHDLTIYSYSNNHYAGYGPATAESLRKLVSQLYPK